MRYKRGVGGRNIGKWLMGAHESMIKFLKKMERESDDK
jgi:hypothetical protein